MARTNNNFEQLVHSSTISETQQKEIIDALGGMENILQLICTQHKLLSDDDIDIIKSILTAKSDKTNQIVSVQSVNSMPQKLQRQETTFTVYLCASNNIIHRVFEEEKASKFEEIIYSKWWILGAIIPLCCKFFASSLYAKGLINAAVSYGIALPFTLAIIFWLTSHLFTLNISMVKRLIIQFDFLYKISTAFIMLICQFIIDNVADNSFEKYPFLTILFYLFGGVAIIFTIVLISSLDGWRVTKTFKIIFLSVFVFFLIAYGIVSYFQFEEYFITIFGKSISVRVVFLNGNMNIILFFGKQLYAVWYYRNSKQCECLYTNPYMEWIEDWDNHQVSTQKSLELAK